MKLTNQQLNKIKNIPFRYDLHWKLWNWLSKHPDKGKDDYFKLNKEEKPLAGNQLCFACTYAHEIGVTFKDYSCCYYCPFEHEMSRSCLNGIYNLYIRSKGKKERIKYAKMIRDMPLNKAYNFKDVK